MLKKKSFRKYFSSSRSGSADKEKEAVSVSVSAALTSTARSSHTVLPRLPSLPSLPLYDSVSAEQALLPALPCEQHRESNNNNNNNNNKSNSNIDKTHELTTSSTLTALSSGNSDAAERESHCEVSERERVPWEALLPTMEMLSMWHCDLHIDEVLYTIYGPHTRNARSLRGIFHWTCFQVGQWLQSLSFLGSEQERAALRAFVEEEGIDGEVFTTLLHEGERFALPGLTYVHRLVLNLVLFQWAHPRNQRIYHLADRVFRGIPLSVQTGFVDDLSVFPRETAAALVRANERCVTTGEGAVYGQFVVLGHSEFRQVDKRWLPFGLPNQKFVLSRRKNANGLAEVRRFLSHSSAPLGTSSAQTTHCHSHSPQRHPYYTRLQFADQTLAQSDGESAHGSAGGEREWDEVVVELTRCPDRDVYQFGRAANSTNDWMLRGHVHAGEDGAPTGPLSRYACRVECERVAPFRCFIYAGGFDEHQVLRAHGVELPDGTHDGFTTFGVRLFDPDVGDWVEVSVSGRTHTQRPFLSEALLFPERERATPCGNLLRDGCVIDLCGVLLLFQDPVTMANAKEFDPQQVINELNARRPQCPVLFSQIAFSFLDAHTRVRKAHERIENSTDARQSGLRCGPIHVPSVDYSHVEAEQRSFVFPACGHVHGFHASLQGRSCPLCRQAGSFVPIAFTFDSALGAGEMPTHVFNPCGHVADFQTVRQWSALPLIDKAHSPQWYNTAVPVHAQQNAHTMRNAEMQRRCAVCPFCATQLDRDTPYSKLILQTETHTQYLSATFPTQATATGSDEDGEFLQYVRSCGWQSEEFQTALILSQQALFRKENRASLDMRQPRREWVFPSFAPHVHGV